MTVVLDAKQIIDEGIVENNRIEYKRDWNPEPILHTLCAFANDIDNTYGGYIIIGIEEKEGRPSSIVGIEKDSVDEMNRLLFNLCNQIEPRYLVDTEYSEYEGKGVFVIKAYGGRNRPYKCPVSLSSKKTEKAYYIRKNGITVRANSNEERELFRISGNMPFDDRMNMSASVNDLNYGLMTEFIRAVGSRLTEGIENKNWMDIARDLRVIDGPKEDERPVNVGLMFFNERPDDYFRYARIEVVYKPDPTGKGMKEMTFTGPLDRQLRNALKAIEPYITEYVTKVEDRPEAIREFNYPMAAVEEALSNAVYHKGYDIPEPITVTIVPDRMEILSIPGPDHSITDEDLSRRHLVSKTYRNRRIGEFLKELNLAEGRNTGVPLMLEAMRRNNSNPPEFLTDSDRTYLKVVLPVNRHFVQEAADTGKENMESEPHSKDEEMVTEIIRLLKKNSEMSIREISDSMGYNSPPSSLRKVVRILRAAGVVEYTDPDSLRSPTQRLRLGRMYEH